MGYHFATKTKLGMSLYPSGDNKAGYIQVES